MYKRFIKKWILFFCLLCFSLYMGLKNGQLFFSYLFWFILAAAIISFLWLILSYFAAGLAISRKTIRKVQEDDLLELDIEIRNKGILLLINLVIEDNFTPAPVKERKKHILADYLGGFSSESFRYSCVCPLRGYYNIGPVKIYFFDPFGLFYFKKTFKVYSELYVYPRTFQINKFPELSRGNVPWFGIETSRVSGDEDEFFGVREYKSGDPIKKIHWISSARKNQLIVKEYQRQSFFKATILFNLDKDNNFGEGKNSVCEYIIKITASVARYLLNRGVSLEIIAHTDEIVHIEANRGEEHLEDILRFLAMARIESRVSFTELFESSSQYISEDSTLIPVMLDTDREYIPNMLSLGGRNVTLLPIILVTSTFLDESLDYLPQEVFDIKLPGAISLNPVYISRGERLEEKF